MEMNTAGSLRDGQMVWALAKVKESFDLFGGDQVDSYLLFSNPHQYGKSIDIRFTPIRVVCNNTLSLSLGMQAERQVKIGHRVEFNPSEVKEALGIASEKLAVYKEMAEYLGSKRFTMDKLVEYYNTVFPRTSNKRVQDKKLSVDTLSRNAKQCLDVLESQPGAEYAEGSWWQAYNSVTYITDHVQGRNADNRLYSSWFGGNQARKKDALETAIEFAEAA
jgi:phage/plasmid-like protein (TIGR03299 family)